MAHTSSGLSGSPGEPVLVYDRIGTNKRQTWLMMILFVAVAFGVAVNNQVGGPFWVALLSAIAFVLFVVLPLHLALVLHRARRRSGRDGPAAG